MIFFRQTSKNVALGRLEVWVNSDDLIGRRSVHKCLPVLCGRKIALMKPFHWVFKEHRNQHADLRLNTVCKGFCDLTNFMNINEVSTETPYDWLSHFPSHTRRHMHGSNQEVRSQRRVYISRDLWPLTPPHTQWMILRMFSWGLLRISHSDHGQYV